MWLDGSSAVPLVEESKTTIQCPRYSVTSQLRCHQNKWHLSLRTIQQTKKCKPNSSIALNQSYFAFHLYFFKPFIFIRITLHLNYVIKYRFYLSGGEGGGYQNFTCIGISKLLSFTLNPRLFFFSIIYLLDIKKDMAQKVNYANKIIICACKIS